MKKLERIIALIFFAVVSIQVNAQSKLRIGLYATGGTSSLVQGMDMNMHMYNSGFGSTYGNNKTMYNYTGSVGGGVNFTVPIDQRWSFVGNLGYLNRGASYGINSSYNSRYRFSYIDVWTFCQYNTLNQTRLKFTASLGLTESTLISARNKTTAMNDNMMNNMNRIDIGIIFGPGLEFTLKEKGAIPVRLLYMYGFRNAFAGMYYNMGMHSNNTALLLQIGHLFEQ